MAVVETPGVGAVVVDGGAAQVTAVPAGEGAAGGAVEECAVVPHDHVAGLLPVEGVHILGLRHMLVERIAQLHGLLVGEALDVVQMGADV